MLNPFRHIGVIQLLVCVAAFKAPPRSLAIQRLNIRDNGLLQHVNRFPSTHINQIPGIQLLRKNSGLRAAAYDGTSTKNSPASINRAFKRITWFSGWCQAVLAVISAIILTFANSVRHIGSSWASLWSNGFAFTSIGVAIGFVNTFWTWNITRFSKRITAGRVEEQKVIPTFRKFSIISVYLSIIGMFFTLIGAEQIVGTLASKVLSFQGSFFPLIATTSANSGLVQALDIFLVQANTNAVVGNFIPLISYLWLQTQLPYRSPGNRQGPKFAGESSTTGAAANGNGSSSSSSGTGSSSSSSRGLGGGGSNNNNEIIDAAIIVENNDRPASPEGQPSGNSKQRSSSDKQQQQQEKRWFDDEDD